MKKGLNIFCNNNIESFLNSLLSEYELNIKKLDEIKGNIQKTQANIIIINDHIDLIEYSKLSDNCLIILTSKNLGLNILITWMLEN